MEPGWCLGTTVFTGTSKTGPALCPEESRSGGQAEASNFAGFSGKEWQVTLFELTITQGRASSAHCKSASGKMGSQTRWRTYLIRQQSVAAGGGYGPGQYFVP